MKQEKSENLRAFLFLLSVIPESDMKLSYHKFTTMSMNLFVGRIHIHIQPCLRPSLLPPPLASSSSTMAVEYLIQSCGLSSEKALKASKHIHHLNSFDKPNAVLTFLREIDISEANIRIAVSREPRILCSNVENSLRPNIAKLQEVGLSIQEISSIIAENTIIFLYNFVPKIEFLMEFFGSVENVSLILKTPAGDIVRYSMENVLMPNLSFLQEQCGFSPRQLINLMNSRSQSRLIRCKHDVLKMYIERAEKLGVPRSSPNFFNALLTVSYQYQSTIDAKLDNLKNIGFSPEEVALMISKAPMVLRIPEKLVNSKMEHMIKEAGCVKSEVVGNPVLLTYSLEKRMIPRNTVRKLLMLKGLYVSKIKYASFIMYTEEKFVKKFIVPYEHAIPGLHQAYADASSGKIGGVEVLKSISS